MERVDQPEIKLSKADIEQAIKEYVNNRIEQTLDETSSTVTFKLKDEGIDDGTGPYCSDYQLYSANIKLKFLA